METWNAFKINPVFIPLYSNLFLKINKLCTLNTTTQTLFQFLNDIKILYKNTLMILKYFNLIILSAKECLDLYRKLICIVLVTFFIPVESHIKIRVKAFKEMENILKWKIFPLNFFVFNNLFLFFYTEFKVNGEIFTVQSLWKI